MVPAFPAGGQVAHRLSFWHSLLSTLSVLALARFGGRANDTVVALASRMFLWWLNTGPLVPDIHPLSLGRKEGFGDTAACRGRSPWEWWSIGILANTEEQLAMMEDLATSRSLCNKEYNKNIRF